MPNWCSNTIRVTGETAEIDRFENFLEEKNGKGWFDFFRPCPEELATGESVGFQDEPKPDFMEKYGAANWYDWNVQNWGCKWNCDAQDWNREDDTISFWFDSPWGPPTELYNFIVNELDMQVAASYNEEGMAFVGEFVDGENFTYEYDYDDIDSLNDVPEHLVEEWNLRDSLESYQEMQDEDDEDNDK